jgi:intracellular multiplication protein IcmE
MKEQGADCGVLHSSGHTAQQLKEAGYSAQQLKEGGYSAQQLKEVGFSVQQLNEGEFSAQQLKEAGFSAQQLKEGGFSAAAVGGAFSLKGQALQDDIGYPAIELAAFRHTQNWTNNNDYTPSARYYCCHCRTQSSTYCQ